MTIKIFESKSLGLTIEIDHEKCQGHSNCVDECPSDVFELIDGKSACIAIDDCVECCVCVDACPEKAIKHSSCLD
jgi:NAD-dependent dihydropyrimidine dehydrogenase PreA subunit